MADDPTEKVEKLKQACDRAYVTYGSSCSHAVWYVISQYDPSQRWMDANQLVGYLATSAKWKPVELRELSKLASQGTLIVGGLKQNSGHGHVIVVYPGPEKPSGGFQFRRAGERMVTQSSSGSYARAMSTSSGSWPGARSFGDKTVRDAWGHEGFPLVKFWKYVGDGGGVV